MRWSRRRSRSSGARRATTRSTRCCRRRARTIVPASSRTRPRGHEQRRRRPDGVAAPSFCPRRAQRLAAMQGVLQLTHARAAIYTAARLRILSPPVDFPIFQYFAPDQGALVNKNELIDAVAAATGLTKADAEKALEAVFTSIGDALKKGLEVRLVGFGTFSVTKRAASEGRN